MIKIAIVGPESTGKSTLAAELASYFQAQWVKEYAREYIDKLERPYQKADLKVIAAGQLALEKAVIPIAQKLIICDTNLLVIKIWSEYLHIDECCEQYTYSIGKKISRIECHP